MRLNHLDTEPPYRNTGAVDLAVFQDGLCLVEASGLGFEDQVDLVGPLVDASNALYLEWQARTYPKSSEWLGQKALRCSVSAAQKASTIAESHLNILPADLLAVIESGNLVNSVG
jgi:hypothetical protein